MKAADNIRDSSRTLIVSPCLPFCSKTPGQPSIRHRVIECYCVPGPGLGTGLKKIKEVGWSLPSGLWSRHQVDS